MKFKGLLLIAASAAAIAGANPAGATIYIGTQLNGSPVATQASGLTTAAWMGLVGDVFVNSVAGSAGIAPTVLNSVLLATKTTTVLNTVDIWVTETDITTLTGKFPSSFTENLLSPGWTVTQKTYYSLANALYGGTLLGSHVFTFADVATVPAGPMTLTGPFSVTHQYTIVANAAGSTLSTITVSNTPVPEPTTWAMMIGGLALTGAAMRRRKVAVRFA